jgi:hypothetical protein
MCLLIIINSQCNPSILKYKIASLNKYENKLVTWKGELWEGEGKMVNQGDKTKNGKGGRKSKGEWRERTLKGEKEDIKVAINETWQH